MFPVGRCSAVGCLGREEETIKGKAGASAPAFLGVGQKGVEN